MEKIHHVVNRSSRLDTLRGLAVVGMVIAHGLFFFHDASTSFLSSIQGFLNTVTLTIFVFVFGQSTSRWLDAHAFAHPKHIWTSALKRAGTIYGVYILTSCIAIVTSSAPTNLLGQVLSAALFIAPPNFTEYMPLFIMLILLAPIARPILRYSRESFMLTSILAAFSYLLGITVYELETPQILVGIKALFAGHEGLLRFPVLFYLPVSLFGLWWQYDTDHKTQGRTYTKLHIAVLIGSVTLTTLGILTSQLLTIPLLNPVTRWPPSLVFLTMGVSTSAVLIFLIHSFIPETGAFRRIVSYFGRDALDLWATHLIILFAYQKFIATRFTDPLLVIFLLLLLFALSVLLSSLTLFNRTKFPLGIAFEGTTRFRKRYVIATIFVLLLSVWMTATSTASPYGNYMNAPALIVQQKIPPQSTAKLTAGQTWYVKHDPTPKSVELVLTISDFAQIIPLSAESVRILVNNQVASFSGQRASDDAIHFTKPVEDMEPGVYNITASIDNGNTTVDSNPVTVYVSEPLIVAWTFDWEGWDAPNEALKAIDDYTFLYPTIKFTHFVNPRTFLPGVLSAERQKHLLTYLENRAQKGDEIAMHLHMQYDLVRAAGVATKSAHPWGFLTDQGYDTPITDYTDEEFMQIAQYALGIAQNAGLPPMNGFRAGGWFIDAPKLYRLQSLGFTYDSSGRDRPSIGPFSTSPWNLAIGAQPFYPSIADQNIPTQNTSGILEVPNNGLSTNDQTVETLIARINAVYQGGILTSPKVLVFTSHPQMYTREFPKIPEVLKKISAISEVAGRGPAIFATTGEIVTLWTSLNN